MNDFHILSLCVQNKDVAGAMRVSDQSSSEQPSFTQGFIVLFLICQADNRVLRDLRAPEVRHRSAYKTASPPLRRNPQNQVQNKPPVRQSRKVVSGRSTSH